jgi:hypothetical protein
MPKTGAKSLRNEYSLLDGFLLFSEEAAHGYVLLHT